MAPCSFPSGALRSAASVLPFALRQSLASSVPRRGVAPACGDGVWKWRRGAEAETEAGSEAEAGRTRTGGVRTEPLLAGMETDSDQQISSAYPEKPLPLLPIKSKADARGGWGFDSPLHQAASTSARPAQRDVRSRSSKLNTRIQYIMDDGLEQEGSSSSWSSKRRRQNDDDDHSTSSRAPRRRRKHIYLALDDWSGGYSIHKLDADKILDDDEDQEGAAVAKEKLPEPAAVRLASPTTSPMAFAALGSSIFIATNPRCHGVDHAPPCLVYDTETGALTLGPRVSDSLADFNAAVAVDEEKLYALTSFSMSEPRSLRVLSMKRTVIPDREFWDPETEWSWDTVAAPPPSMLFCIGENATTYALHPDGRTIFMSTTSYTYSLDTSNGVWKEIGEWALPFRGQAFFDADLDAWVGLHRGDDGCVCYCPVVSRSAAASSTTRPPECRMLKERLSRRHHHPTLQQGGRRARRKLAYMGDSRFCFVEILDRSDDGHFNELHVTLFGLGYDRTGELRTKIRRATRSYLVYNTNSFILPAVFWM